MKNYISMISQGIVVCLVSVLSSSANPNPPSAYPILSEIQVTDSLHWNVEVDVKTYPVGLTYPCSTNTFLLFCGQSQPPADSMRRSAKMEQFDTRGIAVLTPQHFPGLKLIKGATLFLQYRYTYSDGFTGQYTWQTQIPAGISPQQSVIGSVETHCCVFIMGPCQMYCPTTVYSVSSHSTIGLPNSYTGVSSQGNVTSTAGSVRLLSPKIRGQIPVAVSGTFSGKGTIDIFTADGSLVRLLSFACNGAGTYTVSWDGNNEQGRTIPAGTYVCRVKLGEDVSCKGFIVW